MTDCKPILIAGPTASGKSGLALALAQEFDGVVVNADASQVYRDLQILSARPLVSEMAGVPHELYGHVEGHVAYSTGAWLNDVAAVLQEARARGQRAVIVGGTGLYFYGLLEGLSPVPDIDPEIRDKWRAVARVSEASVLFRKLEDLDPLMAARLNPSDTQRVVRALEVIESTGQSLTYWQAQTVSPLLKLEETIPFVLTFDRAALYARIDARFATMVELGALDEVRALTAQGFDEGLPVMRALGVRELGAVLNGTLGLEAAIEQASQQSRRYAKRQLTWLRRNMIAWNEVNAQELERILPDIFSKIYKSG